MKKDILVDAERGNGFLLLRTEVGCEHERLVHLHVSVDQCPQFLLEYCLLSAPNSYVQYCSAFVSVTSLFPSIVSSSGSDLLRSSSVSVILLYVFKANVIYNFVACISSLLKQGIQYLMLFPYLVGLCQMLFPSLVGLCQVVFQELVQNIPEKFQLFFIVILSLFHIIYDYHYYYYHHHHRDTCLSSGD